MAHYLYRINGGEVLATSTSAFSTSTYLGSFQPVSSPDGTTLSPAKIKDGTALRNATAGEITNFSIYETQDLIAQLKIDRKAFFDSRNDLDVAFRGLMLAVRDEINTIRAVGAVGLASISEATWVSNVKAKIDAEASPEAEL